MQTSAALASWCFHVRLVMCQVFRRDAMGELPIYAQVPLSELEVAAAVVRMRPQRPTMTEERVIPLDFSKGLWFGAPRAEGT
jgi:hypothetical protein